MSFYDIDQNEENITLNKNNVKDSTIYVLHRKMLLGDKITQNSDFWWLREIVNGDEVKYESKGTNPWDSSPKVEDDQDSYRTGFYFIPNLSQAGHEGEFSFRSTSMNGVTGIMFITTRRGSLKINKTRTEEGNLDRGIPSLDLSNINSLTLHHGTFLS